MSESIHEILKVFRKVSLLLHCVEELRHLDLLNLIVFVLDVSADVDSCDFDLRVCEVEVLYSHVKVGT